MIENTPGMKLDSCFPAAHPVGRLLRGICPAALGQITLGRARQLKWEAGLIFGLDRDSPDQAKDITEESVKSARRMAQLYKTDVLLHIDSDRVPGNDTIILSFPKLKRDPVLNEVQKEYTLPEGIDIVSDEMTIHFDPTGEVDWPTNVMLVSQAVESPAERLRIE